MKMDSTLSRMSAKDAGIVYFTPKKNTSSPWAADFEELKRHPQLFQLLENFEFTHGLPVFTEGTTEKILEARIYRYLVLSSGWDSAIAPDELTHAATWEALAAA